MADVLEEILAVRRQRVSEAKAAIPPAEMERLAKQAPIPVSFAPAVGKKSSVSVIAEMKRRSPSAGELRPAYDVAAIARAYEKGGASALSVLTEPDRFGGDIGDLRTARAACKLPILRKDFVFDPYQVFEARANGADALLLIADMIPASLLSELTACAREAQIEPLVEIYSTESLPAALNSRAALIGVNTRDLRTLRMNPGNIAYISTLIPRDRMIVAESGIKTAADVERLSCLRISAVLVGESLLRQENLEEAVKVLVKAGKRDES